MTSFFAWSRANASQNRRKCDIFFYRSDSIFQPTLPDLPYHNRDIHMGRTGSLARSITISHMLAQQKIQGILAGLPHQIISGRDAHSLGNCGRACGNQTIRVGFIHDTNHARGEQLIIFQITHCGNVYIQLFGRIQNRDAC